MNRCLIKLLENGFWIPLLIFCFLSSSLSAQVTEVAFMKVKGDVNDYLQVEKEWKKAHQKRLEQEKIYAWYLIRRHLGGTEAKYDYVTVTVYPNFGSIQTEYPESLFDGLNLELINKTDATRGLVKTEIYDTPIILEITNLPKFLLIHFMKVEQGNDDEYLQVEDEIWKPAHAEVKKMGIQDTWSVYRQLYPGAYGGEYNFIVVNGFADMKKVTPEPPEGWDDFMKKIHPDKDIAELMKRTLDSRLMIKNELWEIIDVVAPQ